MVDPVPSTDTAVPTLSGDRAEIDLPVASNVLGGESIFLQARHYNNSIIMKLCVQISLAAIVQVWKLLQCGRELRIEKPECIFHHKPAWGICNTLIYLGLVWVWKQVRIKELPRLLRLKNRTLNNGATPGTDGSLFRDTPPRQYGCRGLPPSVEHPSRGT